MTSLDHRRPLFVRDCVLTTRWPVGIFKEEGPRGSIAYGSIFFGGGEVKIVVDEHEKKSLKNIFSFFFLQSSLIKTKIQIGGHRKKKCSIQGSKIV